MSTERRKWELTTTTGKFIDLYKVKFELISRKPELGSLHIIFEDDSEIYLTVAEHKEVLAYIKEDSKEWNDKRQKEQSNG